MAGILQALGQSNALPEATEGLLNRQIQLGQIQQQKQQQEFQNDLGMMKMSMTMMADKSIPVSMKPNLNNNFSTLWNKWNPQMPMKGEMSVWPKGGEQFAQRALKIWDNDKYDMRTKLNMLASLKVEANTVGEAVDTKSMETLLTGDIKKKQEAEALQEERTFEQEKFEREKTFEAGLKGKGATKISDLQVLALQKAQVQGTDSLDEIERALVNKAVSTGGISLQVGEDGSVSFTQGGPDFLTAATQSKIQGDVLAQGDLLATIDQVESVLQEENVGLTGSVRNIMFGTAQQLGALDKVLKISSTVMRNDANLDESVMSKMFDPKLSKLELLKTILAYRFARSLDSKGRLSDKDIEQAKQSIGLGKKLVGIGDIRARLQQMRIDSQGQIERREKLQAGGETTTSEYVYGKTIPAEAHSAILDADGAEVTFQNGEVWRWNTQTSQPEKVR